MTEDNISEIMRRFSIEAKRIYGDALRGVILYGSCARGDFEQGSDIDIMVLLDTPCEKLNEERKKILDVTDQLDWDYDVVLAPIFQNYQVYHNYMVVSRFYQNIREEGVHYA